MRRTSALAALWASVAMSGCQTVAPVMGPVLGAAGFSYSSGKASQEFAYPTTAIQSVSVAERV